MTGETDDPSAGRDPQVWLLGNTHPAADRSIAWRGRLPNLGDPDVLIVDMTTLTEETLREIDDAELDRAQRSIDDKFFGGGGAIIVITQPEFSAPPRDPLTLEPNVPLHARLAGPYAYSSYRILPAVPKTVAVPASRRIKPDDGHDFGAYLNDIGHFTFYIAKWRPRAAYASGCAISSGKVPGQSVMDNSGNYLGFTLVPEGQGVGSGNHPKRVENEGKLVFLPPYTEPAADAIGKILSSCRKALPLCRPASGSAAGPVSAPRIQPGEHAPPREMAPGPTVAKNAPTADLPPPLPAGGAERGGAAGPGTAPPGGGGGTDAFLSYHHEVKDDVARPLAGGLEKRGVTVWWDNTAMRISDDVPKKIKEGLDGARCGVVIVSRGYLDSGWGQTELGAMFGKGMTIFPVLYGVTVEEAQKRLPALSGKIMRSWDGRPALLMDEIAREIKRKCGYEDGEPCKPSNRGARP